MSNKLRSVFEYVLAIGVLIAVWYVYVTFNDVPQFIMPSPMQVWDAFLDMLISGSVYFHFFVTSGEILAGFVFGTILGYLIGYAIVKVKVLEEALMPYILMAQTAPKIALAPLFVIWFGLGLVSKLALVISMVFFPVMLGTVFGMKSITVNTRHLMQIVGLNWWQRIIQVELPSSFPQIFAGLKVGMVQAVIAAIVAEWISGKNGLGYLLVYYNTTYNSPMLFATIIYTIIVGTVFYTLVNVLENRLLFWHESKQLVKPKK